ncbi:MAG: hypothetical protein Q9165_006051 [Trypethelium subeluteriae]
MTKTESTTKAEANVQAFAYLLQTAKPKCTRGAMKTPYKTLATEENVTVAVDALYAGESPEANIAITEGKYAGCSAVIFKPESPFRYSELPLEIRDRIHKIVLHAGTSIHLKSKSSTKAGITAAGYSSKNRLALLGVDKLTRAETFPLVYGKMSFSADTSNTFTKFLVGIGNEARSHLMNVSLGNYIRKDIHMLFMLLAECKELRRLHIVNYPMAGAPAKLARSLSIDAGSWLSSRVTKLGKDTALKPLKFGPGALRTPTHKLYTEKEVALFYEELEKKL